MSFKNISKKILVFMIIATGLISSMGSSYMQTSQFKYVDVANGSDSNSGATTSAALKTIQKAVNLAQPGDTIVVRAGTYNENVVIGTTGTAASPITMTNYSGETVTLNGGSDIALRNNGLSPIGQSRVSPSAVPTAIPSDWVGVVNHNRILDGKEQ